MERLIKAVKNQKRDVFSFVEPSMSVEAAGRSITYPTITTVTTYPTVRCPK